MAQLTVGELIAALSGHDAALAVEVTADCHGCWSDNLVVEQRELDGEGYVIVRGLERH